MSASSKRIWKLSAAQEEKRPWAIVLEGGRAIRLRHGKRYVLRRGARIPAGGDSRGDLLECQRDIQWH